VILLPGIQVYYLIAIVDSLAYYAISYQL